MKIRKIKVIKRDQIEKAAETVPPVEMTKERADRELIATVSSWVTEKKRQFTSIPEEVTQS